jgi:anti-anti-sigma regulatory factor
MLRISALNELGIIRLKLEGKLAHEWVEEARKAWGTLATVNGHKDAIVDLRGVSFVDGEGHQLLAEMRHAGAELIGSGPLISALIDEIEDEEAVTSQDEPDGN